QLGRHGIDDLLRVVTDNGPVIVDPGLTPSRDAFARRTGIDIAMVGLGNGGKFVKGDTRAVNWLRLARSAFMGKGSPEACRIVLQLARRWGLAPNLQAYADSYLGLDCNGFVGNYLWHVVQKNPWTELGLDDGLLGPNASITEFVPDAWCLNEWDEID